MTDQDNPRTTPDNSATSEEYAAAIRQAAFSCDGDCGMTEQECDAAHPIQVGAWTHGVISDVYGSPEALGNAVHAVRDRRMERLAAELAAERTTVRRVREAIADQQPDLEEMDPKEANSAWNRAVRVTCTRIENALDQLARP